MKTLLVEVFTEEIPSGYVVPALDSMASLMRRELKAARIDHAAMRTYGTPRRLALMVDEVAPRQTPATTRVVGPPVTAAYDKAGQPTKAAQGFAANNGVPVKKLSVTTTSKGEYLCVDKEDPGQASSRLLKVIIPMVIGAIPFPKSMRWADLELSFARPIHAIVSLLGDEVVSFLLGQVRSGRRTFGHRFMHPQSISLSDSSGYLESLRSASVLADIGERKETIRGHIENAANGLGGRILSDEPLLDTVTNIVEFVAVSSGTFDRSFLKLPSEVLITAMREHQKYFSVVGADGTLLPHFIAVNNTSCDDMAAVTRGHERVLRARLEDARFFFDADSKLELSTMVDQLGGVLFQAKLGSMLEKTRRVQKLAEFLAEAVSPEVRESVSRAASLSKADLTSHMVSEFPKLQGVMGRIYAGLNNEPEDVARAIEEHYFPAYAGGPLPATVSGAILSISDKLDTVCGCFGVGLVPTGTTDPYALRRQAIGILHILASRSWNISLSGLIAKSLELLAGKTTEDQAATRGKVISFFQHRLEYILVEQGFSKDVVAAVVGASIDLVPSVFKRTQSLDRLKGAPEFEPLAVAVKRVCNIARKRLPSVNPSADATIQDDGIRPELFDAPCERSLYDAVQSVRDAAAKEIGQGAFDEALRIVASLKGPIDDFFNGVMVMAEDDALRKNRLAMLAQIEALFGLFADFSRIST